LKVLVTGGMGYIGSHTVIELLKSKKFKVISADNCERSTPETASRIELITGEKVMNYPVDIAEKESFFKIFEENPDVEAIIHFAAYKSVPESVAKPLLYYRNNLQVLENVLEACAKFHVHNLIFSSSCSVYGEVSDLPVNELTPLREPFSPYAHTKQIGEKMIEFYAQMNPSLKAVNLRYFNPVGADMSGKNGELSPDKPNNLLPIITQVAIGKLSRLTVFGTDYPTRDGTCIRDYIHVSDIATAHIQALQFLIDKKNEHAVEVFNLGSGQGVTVFEMVHAFEKVIQKTLPVQIGERRAGDVSAIYSDSSKAEKLLGWVPQYSLDDMVDSAWRWELYLQNVL
jgi:UDP-glucose 4-epimerase